MIGASEPATMDVTWYPRETPEYRIRVGNISAMMAGCPAYMKAWNTRPIMIAARMTKSFFVSIMGKAKKPQVAPMTAPAMYTGLRPKRSDNLPTMGTTEKWTAWATSSSRRIRVVSAWTTVCRYAMENVTT